MLVSHDAVFLENQFMKTDDQHKDGQTNYVGHDSIIHGENSLEELEFEVAEVALNTEPKIEVGPVTDIIPADVDHVNLFCTTSI